MSIWEHLDLFSGIGGFALAARWAGIKTIGFSEIDPFCIELLKQHWPDVKNYGNIKEMDFPNHVDLITGGFPCQPFSVAGKQKGCADDRYLWPEMFRIICQSRPSWCILENVPGIIPHLDPILEDLEREGYVWRAYLISARSVAAPHKRERLWVVANTDSIRRDKRSDHRQERHVQSDLDRNVAEIQSEWPQFQPQSWQIDEIEKWFSFNAENSGSDDGLSNGMDRNKALGNAIVPQIPYLFMQIMLHVEH